MFLNELKEEERVCFFNLVSIFAKVDNNFAKEERTLLNDYREELGIVSEEIKFMEYEEIIEILKNSSDRSQTIIYFELVGLALVDGKYESEEVDFLEDIALQLDIPRDKRIAIANYFYNLQDIYKFSTVNADKNIKVLREKAEIIL